MAKAILKKSSSSMMGSKVKGFDTLHPTQGKLYEVLANPDNDFLSLREIAKKIHLKSPNTVAHHLKQLEKKGYIMRDKLTGRINTFTDPIRDIIYFNLYGTAECGPGGFFTDDNVVERIPFPAKRLKVSRDSFLVEAYGDSMEPKITEGDLVLIEKSRKAKNGDIAVVIHEGTAKIKQIFREKTRVVLQSLNRKYEPIIADLHEVFEVGVVSGVIHRFNRFV